MNLDFQQNRNCDYTILYHSFYLEVSLLGFKILRENVLSKIFEHHFLFGAVLSKSRDKQVSCERNFKNLISASTNHEIEPDTEQAMCYPPIFFKPHFWLYFNGCIGGSRGAPPARAPKGPYSLVSTYKFYETQPPQELAPPYEVGVPPMGNPGSTTGLVQVILKD